MIQKGVVYFMEETEFSSANVVLKEYALPNIILICICTLVYLGFAFSPIMLIIDAARDSAIGFCIITGIFSLILLASYIICLCYFILTIKYKNICCTKEEVYIRYGNKWIVKFKYSDIDGVGDVYFHGQYINVKKSLHYKRGQQTNKLYGFYLNKKNKGRFYYLMMDRAKNIEKILGFNEYTEGIL